MEEGRGRTYELHDFIPSCFFNISIQKQVMCVNNHSVRGEYPFLVCEWDLLSWRLYYFIGKNRSILSRKAKTDVLNETSTSSRSIVRLFVNFTVV
jgi:hypothetical protein